MSLYTLSEIIADKLPTLDDGKLILKAPAGTWRLCLAEGRLIYPTSDFHRIRRWSRAVYQHRPSWSWNSVENRPDLDFWEIDFLKKGFVQRQLTPIQGKLIIRSVVQECLFELKQTNTLEFEWIPLSADTSPDCVTAALSVREIQMLHSKTTNMWKEWRSANIVKLNPNCSPVLTQTLSSENLPIDRKYLSGQWTLWDISLQVGRSLSGIVKSLLPLAENHWLEFQQLPDLKMPNASLMASSPESPPSYTPENPPSPATPPLETSESAQQTFSGTLIACIDDSPVLAHTLRKILEPAGYQMMSIPEPMRGFSQLIEHRPSLILLDLNLPNADGYSICKFLRDTPVFETTPIIILTGQDTKVDRLKAQLAGATDFLAKPPESQALLTTLTRCIGAAPSSTVS